MPECIHGLDLAACDACSPKKAPVLLDAAVKTPAPRKANARVAGAPPARKLASRDEQRLHVVLSFDDFAEALTLGEVVDPIYFHGPEELAWRERRRADDALDQVVLVSTYGATNGTTALALGSVTLLAVANTVVQARVRELLAATAFKTKVSVYPPWFELPEE